MLPHACTHPGSPPPALGNLGCAGTLTSLGPCLPQQEVWDCSYIHCQPLYLMPSRLTPGDRAYLYQPPLVRGEKRHRESDGLCLESAWRVGWWGAQQSWPVCPADSWVGTDGSMGHQGHSPGVQPESAHRTCEGGEEIGLGDSLMKRPSPCPRSEGWWRPRQPFCPVLTTTVQMLNLSAFAPDVLPDLSPSHGSCSPSSGPRFLRGPVSRAAWGTQFLVRPKAHTHRPSQNEASGSSACVAPKPFTHLGC